MAAEFRRTAAEFQRNGSRVPVKCSRWDGSGVLARRLRSFDEWRGVLAKRQQSSGEVQQVRRQRSFGKTAAEFRWKVTAGALRLLVLRWGSRVFLYASPWGLIEQSNSRSRAELISNSVLVGRFWLYSVLRTGSGPSRVVVVLYFM
jgi:hypothetical protein